jgi:hypothetical protein
VNCVQDDRIKVVFICGKGCASHLSVARPGRLKITIVWCMHTWARVCVCVYVYVCEGGSRRIALFQTILLPPSSV